MTKLRTRGRLDDKDTRKSITYANFRFVILIMQRLLRLYDGTKVMYTTNYMRYSTLYYKAGCVG